MDRKRIGIFIFHYVEVLDFCGPYEVFITTRLNEEERYASPPPFEVLLVAEEKEMITASGGLRVMPDCTISECPPLDILVVSGGGVQLELENDRVIAWLSKTGKKVETLASVCTGSLLLGKAGFLDGRRATTHWRSLDLMRQSFPSAIVEDKLHVVEDGNIITSAGISAGIDMALHVVRRYCGEQVARATARNMEYKYPEDNLRRI